MCAKPLISIGLYLEIIMKERKMSLKTFLSKEEKNNLVDYMMEMIRLGVNDLKMKVVEICQ